MNSAGSPNKAVVLLPHTTAYMGDPYRSLMPLCLIVGMCQAINSFVLVGGVTHRDACAVASCFSFCFQEFVPPVFSLRQSPDFKLTTSRWRSLYSSRIMKKTKYLASSHGSISDPEISDQENEKNSVFRSKLRHGIIKY